MAIPIIFRQNIRNGIWIIYALCLIIGSGNLAYALSAREYMERGMDYANRGEYGQAIIEYNSAIKLNPNYKEAYNSLGEAYYKKGHYENAIKAFSYAIKLSPTYIEAHNNLGLSFERKGDMLKAKKAYEVVLKIDPINVEGLFNLGGILYKIEMLRAAIKKYERIIEINPKYTPAYLKLGDIYLKEYKDSNKAEKFYQKAKGYSPNDPVVYLHLGILYTTQGDINAAINEYEKALKIDNNHTKILAPLGMLYLMEKRYKNAISIYTKLIKLQPYQYLHHYNLGLAYERLSQYESAKKEYELAIRINPFDELSNHHLEEIILNIDNLVIFSPIRQRQNKKHLILGASYFKGRHFPLTIYEYQRAIKLNPQDTESRKQLGKLYEYCYITKEAMKQFNHVLELNPDDLEAKDRLERLYWLNEASLSVKEEIVLENLPPSMVKLLIIDFQPIEVSHHEIESFSLVVLKKMLEEFPQVTVVGEKEKRVAMADLRLKTVSSQNDLVKIGEKLQANFVQYVEIKEDKDTITFIASLTDIGIMKELLKTTITAEGNNKVKDAVEILLEKIIPLIPLKGEIIKITENNFIINLGSIHRLKMGDQLSVKDITEKQVVAKIKVVEIEPKIAKCSLITPGGQKFIHVGQRVVVIK